MNKFYITTAIPYVNAPPHIGHSLEFVQADVVARFQKLLEKDVCLLSGGDENSLKNVQAAENEGITPQELVDKNSKLFQELARKLNVEFNVFQKGSSLQHHASSQKLWELCLKNGDIYKKEYSGLYCVGCEAFYTEEELDEKGECYEHPGKKLEEVTEENYFFKLSKYQKNIIDLIQTGKLSIIPEKRKNEVLSFLMNPIQDISISRSNERAKSWGVEVPNDPTQRMYVWFDALNIYQSGVGFGWDEEKYKTWWPADLHVIGKGIIRFHAIYWPAFLISAHLPLPKQILVHEYFTVNGQKMSKSVGNVIDPIELIDKYGADAIRFYFLKHFSPFSDGDFSEDKFKLAYNADLANGLGNLVSRVAKLCERVNLNITFEPKISLEYKKIFEGYRFNEILGDIWKKISTLDKEIGENEPWKIEDKEELERILNGWVSQILEIAFNLKPFLPEASDKIEKIFREEIKLTTPLFPRI